MELKRQWQKSKANFRGKSVIYWEVWIDSFKFQCSVALAYPTKFIRGLWCHALIVPPWKRKNAVKITHVTFRKVNRGASLSQFWQAATPCVKELLQTASHSLNLRWTVSGICFIYYQRQVCMQTSANNDDCICTATAASGNAPLRRHYICSSCRSLINTTHSC